MVGQYIETCQYPYLQTNISAQFEAPGWIPVFPRSCFGRTRRGATRWALKLWQHLATTVCVLFHVQVVRSGDSGTEVELLEEWWAELWHLIERREANYQALRHLRCHYGIIKISLRNMKFSLDPHRAARLFTAQDAGFIVLICNDWWNYEANHSSSQQTTQQSGTRMTSSRRRDERRPFVENFSMRK